MLAPLLSGKIKVLRVAEGVETMGDLHFTECVSPSKNTIASPTQKLWRASSLSPLLLGSVWSTSVGSAIIPICKVKVIEVSVS